VLQPGDILFYESSKCLHGRPQRFRGSWYTSLFVHYYPYGWDEIDHAFDAHYAIPPQWMHPSTLPAPTQPKLELVGTSSWYEPECPDGCCPCQEAVTDWRSRVGANLLDNIWIDPNMERRLLFHPELSLFPKE